MYILMGLVSVSSLRVTETRHFYVMKVTINTKVWWSTDDLTLSFRNLKVCSFCLDDDLDCAMSHRTMPPDTVWAQTSRESSCCVHWQINKLGWYLCYCTNTWLTSYLSDRCLNVHINNYMSLSPPMWWPSRVSIRFNPVLICNLQRIYWTLPVIHLTIAAWMICSCTSCLNQIIWTARPPFMTVLHLFQAECRKKNFIHLNFQKEFGL